MGSPAAPWRHCDPRTTPPRRRNRSARRTTPVRIPPSDRPRRRRSYSQRRSRTRPAPAPRRAAKAAPSAHNPIASYRCRTLRTAALCPGPATPPGPSPPPARTRPRRISCEQDRTPAAPPRPRHLSTARPAQSGNPAQAPSLRPRPSPRFPTPQAHPDRAAPPTRSPRRDSGAATSAAKLRARDRRPARN